MISGQRLIVFTVLTTFTKKYMTLKLGLTILLLVSSQFVFAMGDLRMAQGDSLSGKPAPDFTLMKTDGTKSTLNEARAGRKAVIFFWATWCPHCRTELQVLAGRVEELKSKNIEVILVDIGEDQSNVVSYLTAKKISLVSFLDTEEEVARQYSLRGVPTLFFVGQDGIIKSVRHDLPAGVEGF